MKATEDLRAAKAAKAGQGFAPKATGSQQGSAPVPDTQEFALTFANAAEANIASQLQDKARTLQDIDQMLDSAVEAIAGAEEDILSGNRLESKLAARRSQYAFECVGDVKVSLAFDSLNTLDVLAKPVQLPSVADTIKAISPAQRRQLDQAVLGPAK